MENKIFSGYWGKCHCQGIAVDRAHGFIYYSFTTKLVKSDLEGNIIGTVDNIIGHLGCIDFNEKDGKVYASLEYKNDSIGKGILKSLGISDENLKDGFYVAIFDVDKIDRMEMDAEGDGVMRAVYLKTVVSDYEGSTVNGGAEVKHVHGCSGIDGLTVGPDFGSSDKECDYLFVCYGIYSDLSRTDNDYQVILKYDYSSWWDSVAKPLSQSAMHETGPDEPEDKYFLYTGNTTYGIQNFEYDRYTGDYILCVYPGKKPEFPNYPTFVIDGAKAPVEKPLSGYADGTVGKVLTLRDTGLSSGGISGIDFGLGETGFYSFGDGRYFVSEHFRSGTGEQATNVCLYTLKRDNGVWQFIREADK